jgi:isoaspartyl peptidase/L-asparaginase-like protein (Ntn-hydrolase superfamily)
MFNALSLKLSILVQWHITESSQRDWARYKRMINDANSSGAAPAPEAQLQEHQRQTACSATSPAQKRQKTAGDVPNSADMPLTVPGAAEDDADFSFDTVGAVCMDAQGEKPVGAVS